MRSAVRTPLLLTLALLAAVAPFGTDLYLSAFPAMTIDLGTTAAGVQLSLTAFLIGAGVGQLVFGPLSDRVGRYAPLLAGLLIYVAASVAATLAPTIALLVIARFVQGLAGSAGMVIGRAIIADLAKGTEAARAMALMMLVGGIAPIVAPFAGSVLAAPLGWRGLLGIVAALGVVALPLVLLFVRETHPRGVRHAMRTDSSAPAGRLLSRRYIGYACAYAFAFATMMAYISASPFVYQTMMGFDEVQYGLAFAVNALALTVSSVIGSRLTHRIPLPRLLRIGLLWNLAAILVLLILVVVGVPAIWLAAPILAAVCSLGFVMGNATALALEAAHGRAGSGSAGLGFLQFTLAGLVSPLVGIGGEESALPLALTMLVASVVANAAFLIAQRADAAGAAVTV
ncbi:multidrug effflux MFS transporter [Microbacterium sp. SORGH_AS_0862]|uniref:multidrug effflux MFS transporter n=1 Tax=Microbacterium sp. SORGH_AS_0862 TaxID=3041789 RepID=UPI0027907B3B|nr:multidrug effflux MFS transporter [Microbacterium sp. SORGH_AS_0862]MDQ1206700.1 DHA1 family bicyclomycin/chloramphenicol resistance-like MFS transporter [Microbacterium sp. SORGH_AS_0862]